MTARSYRMKPVVVEAMRWTGTQASAQAIVEWAAEHGGHLTHWQDRISGEHFLRIGTPEGALLASPGEYIIRGVLNDFSVCHSDVFEQTYEPA